MCSFAVVRTRSIWMAVGLHFGWNFITHRLFFNRDILEVRSPGGEVVNGFDGAEGTVAGMIVVVVAMLLVALGAQLYGRDPER